MRTSKLKPPGEQFKGLTLVGPGILRLTLSNWRACQKTVTAVFVPDRDGEGREVVRRNTTGIPKYSLPGRRVAMAQFSDGRFYVIGELANGDRFVQTGSFRKIEPVPPNHRLYDSIGGALNARS